MAYKNGRCSVHQSQSGRCVFLSPARRGRGILVAPGFCQASRFPVGTKTQKLLANFFLILTSHS